ncbi:glutaredoxin domain-containing protein [Promicromonospora kroppenstedtii]|uniref:glutaredoxin domain-containing protein n=1 Tax=Promicromonospora kroppenstedtii TaxID=440482 RepID=UPI0009FD884F
MLPASARPPVVGRDLDGRGCPLVRPLRHVEPAGSPPPRTHTPPALHLARVPHRPERPPPTVIVVHTKPRCVQCDAVKRYLDRHGLEFVEVPLTPARPPPSRPPASSPPPSSSCPARSPSAGSARRCSTPGG